MNEGWSCLGIFTLWYLWSGHSNGCPSSGLTMPWHIQGATCQVNLLSTHIQVPNREVTTLEIICLLWVGTTGSWERVISDLTSGVLVPGCQEAKLGGSVPSHEMRAPGVSEGLHLPACIPVPKRKMTLSRK